MSHLYQVLAVASWFLPSEQKWILSRLRVNQRCHFVIYWLKAELGYRVGAGMAGICSCAPAGIPSAFSDLFLTLQPALPVQIPHPLAPDIIEALEQFLVWRVCKTLSHPKPHLFPNQVMLKSSRNEGTCVHLFTGLCFEPSKHTANITNITNLKKRAHSFLLDNTTCWLTTFIYFPLCDNKIEHVSQDDLNSSSWGMTAHMWLWIKCLFIPIEQSVFYINLPFCSRDVQCVLSRSCLPSCFSLFPVAKGLRGANPSVRSLPTKVRPVVDVDDPTSEPRCPNAKTPAVDPSCGVIPLTLLFRHKRPASWKGSHFFNKQASMCIFLLLTPGDGMDPAAVSLVPAEWDSQRRSGVPWLC